MAAPNWQGLLNWSIKNQSADPTQTAQAISEADRQWLEQALAASTVDYGQQMRAMKAFLDSTLDDSPEQVEQKEATLDALVEIVENIDHARDLTSIGGMKTLMNLLRDKHASIRWRAAEVIATSAQLNEPVQKEYLEADCISKLLNLLEDDNPTCRQKALLALSCLVRNNDQGLQLFIKCQGVGKLIESLQSDEPRNQRKAVQLLAYIASETPSKIPGGQISAEASKLLGADSLDVRESSIQLITKLNRDPSGHRALVQDRRLLDAIEERLLSLSALKNREDVEDAETERQSLTVLKQSLQNDSQEDHATQRRTTRESAAVATVPAADKPIPLLKM